jgi:outer membrane lipoprotein carrier protein
MVILRILLLAGVAATAACDAGRGEEVPEEASSAPDSAAFEGPTGMTPGDSLATAGAADSVGAVAQPSLPGGALPAAVSGAGGGTNPAAAGAQRAPAQQTDAPTAPRTTDEAREVLLRAERAYDAVRSLRADFVQDLTVPLLNSSQRSRGQIFHRKPDRFLMRFSDPAGDVVVADGTQVWLYYPSTDPRQVIRTSAGEAGRLDLQREFLSNPTERFEATLDGTETVDGRSATALTLVPRGASPYRKVRIWVDARDALVRRFEITESNEAVRRVELRNLAANVSLADDLFSFTPPAGTQVFDQ